ncbi:MAG: DUF4154 domain-containing protein [Verrucomicrobia bacterium]|jgi:hypothetical protein|nr:DUF4154 domain-containing protein [Verrucomicrobiota bacterium]
MYHSGKKQTISRWGLVLLMCLAVAQVVQGQALRENDIKARFLISFTKYVEWPDNGVTEETVIGVLDNPVFFETLQRQCTRQQERGKEVKARLVSGADPLDSIDVLFIPRDSEPSPDIWQRALKSGILLVGENRGFLERGGMIEFRLIRNNVRFLINLQSIEKANLRISSKLARLAED